MGCVENPNRSCADASVRHEAGIVVDPRPTEARALGLGPTDSLELDEDVNGNGPLRPDDDFAIADS